MILFPEITKEYSYLENKSILEFLNKNVTNKSSSLETFLIKNLVPSKKKFKNVKKTGSVYAMHRYWTKQPIEVIKECINFFCPPNGIILDPFCGSGTTGSAALLCNRSVILSDLSPIATFIAKNITEKTDMKGVQKALDHIHELMKHQFQKYYSSNCEFCEGSVEIKDWIYTDVYNCPTCLKEIYFITKNSNWNEIKKQKHKKTLYCNQCKENKGRESLEFNRYEPLGLRYKCKPCKLRKHFKKLNKNDITLIKDPELDNIFEITPFIELPIGVNTGQPKIKKITKSNQFFTPITLKVLLCLWKEINNLKDPKIKSKLQFIFTSILYRVTRLYRLRVDGQGGVLSGTLYVPALSQDINVWDVFNERYRKISKGWEELNRNLPEDYFNKRLISTQSATDLSLIPSNSIDYIYTDPPYGGNINYSELNLIWESWFGLQTKTEKEVIINEIGQQKNLKIYEKLFQQSLNEIFRVLKPGHWCTLIFNSSHPKIWTTIQKVILDSGFKISKDLSQIESKMTTAKQTQSRKTARRFIMLHLHKVFTSKTIINATIRDPVKVLSLKSLQRKIITEITSYLTSMPNNAAIYDEIYDEIITKMLPKYKLQDFNLTELLENNFKIVKKDMWSL